MSLDSINIETLLPSEYTQCLQPDNRERRSRLIEISKQINSSLYPTSLVYARETSDSSSSSSGDSDVAALSFKILQKATSWSSNSCNLRFSFKGSN